MKKPHSCTYLGSIAAAIAVFSRSRKLCRKISAAVPLLSPEVDRALPTLSFGLRGVPS
jgi:hypothetical protein